MSSSRRGKNGVIRRFMQRGLPPPQVLLVVPIYAKPVGTTLLKIQQLMYHFTALQVGIDVIPFYPSHSVISVSRNDAVRRLLEMPNPAGICFIDDDMDFPVGIGPSHNSKIDGFNPLYHLIRRGKPVIGYLCTARSMSPTQNVKIAAGTWGPDGIPRVTTDERLISYENHEPFRIPWLGMAWTWIGIEAIRTMVEKLETDRLFNHESVWRHHDEADGVIQRALVAASQGRDLPAIREKLKDDIDLLIRQADMTHEDTGFCRKAEACGVEVWCDPSVEICHIGEYRYGRKDWLARAEIDRERAAGEAARA